ncbi:Glutathione reductase [Xylographa pallens]|nr:Glutathione reductase [Xylographa pallens]
MAPTTKSYDFIVIGGGSGGSGAARRASGWYGAKMLLIENGKSGGTCVNVGSKLTWNFASISEALKDGVHYSYDIPQSISFNFAEFKKKRDTNVKNLNNVYERNWNREGIDLVHGIATFTGEKELEVKLQDGSGTATFSAPHILIATGGHPTKPEDIPGSEHGITSDGFFDIAELPKKMAFVGAGYIAVELAGVMNAIGVECHMFLRHETFLRNFDPMIQDTLTKRYEDAGITIHKNHKGFKKVVSLQKGTGSEKLLRLIGHDGEAFECNELLWAIGRTPEIEELQPANAVAIAAGRALSNRLFGSTHPRGGPHLSHAKLDYANIPTVVFAHPEVGTVGLTEPQAVARFGADGVKTYHTRFTAMYYDFHPADEKARNPTEYKLVCEGPGERIVGMHVLGLGSSEMMQGFAVAVKMGARKQDFDACVAIHPTSAEEVVTMK